MLWRHRSRDQNGLKFNIRSKSLLEPFSTNIFKRSCSLINRVLKNGHDYFFLKKCGSRKSNWKVCQPPGQRPFEVGIKENFAKGLRVCSLWWRCQFLLISIAFGEDRFLNFFSEERARRKERKRGYTFARFLFTATPLHKRLARKKKTKDSTTDWICIIFKRNFWRLFMAAVCSGTMYTWEGKLIQIVVAVC